MQRCKRHFLGSGRSLGVGNGNPLQYSCLENSMERGALWVTGMGLQRMEYNLVTEHTHTHTHIFTHMYTCIYASHIWIILLRFTDNREFTPTPLLPFNATGFYSGLNHPYQNLPSLTRSRLGWSQGRVPFSPPGLLTSPFGALSPRPGPLDGSSFPQGLQHPLLGSPHKWPPSSLPQALCLP